MAKLALEPQELQARTGLAFVEAESALGPVWFAFGQLADGTILGFNRLISDPNPGTEVSQFTDRPARDVLSELLFETDLSHDEVSWRASAEDDDRIWARTHPEAYAYILLHRAPGDRTPIAPRELDIVRDDQDVWSVRHRDVVVHIRPRTGPAVPGGVGVYSHPDDPPSGIIDPGGWMYLASEWEAEAGRLLQGFGPRTIDAREYWSVYDLLLQLVGAPGEALRFLPPDLDELPVRAFWTPLGQWMLRRNPHAFNRAELTAKAAEYETTIAEFKRIYGPPPPRPQ
ncbi:hypothetical protein ACFO1B_27025 [Dactylosporangium siamense]|uniref:hypothetical protein n=1 Tax=Dactylosporangium siamense TaxID=685454 RepID=UPI001940CA99|nr:hypothetical protein [Dactylosporangium siamense]